MDKNTLKEHGIDVSQYKVVGGLDEGAMAMDAALLTTPNSGVPVELLTYFDPLQPSLHRHQYTEHLREA